MTNIILKVIHKAHSILRLNPKERVREEVDTLKRKVILEKKKDVQNLRHANNTIKVLIQRGELEFRVIRNKKSRNKKK